MLFRSLVVFGALFGLTLSANAQYAQPVTLVTIPVRATPTHTIKISVYDFENRYFTWSVYGHYNSLRDAQAAARFLEYTRFRRLDCNDMPDNYFRYCLQDYTPETMLPPGFYFRQQPPVCQPCPPSCQPCPPAPCQRPRLFARLRCR